MDRPFRQLSLIFCISYLIISLCSCSTQTPEQGSATPVPKVSPTRGLATLTPIRTPTTGSAPSISTSCPAAGTARAAVMPSLTSGHSQNIIYVYNQGPSNNPGNGILRRYDVSTNSKTDIVNLSNTWLDDMQISTDGQWVLFLARSSDHEAIQLVRIDGQELQTLFCPASSQDISGAAIGGISWSQDQHFLIFPLLTTGGATSPPAVLGIYLLDMVTGKLQKELGSVNAFPSFWLDNSRVYLIDPLIHMTPANHHISVWNRGQSTNEQLTNPIGNVNLCGDFDVNPDRTQLLLSQCSAPLEGEAIGPSTITTQPAAGGSPHVIYRSQTLAITTIRMISKTTLLVIVKNNVDFSQNGLWKINSDGSNLTPLERTSSQSFLSLSREPVSRDGLLYSFVKSDSEPSGVPVSTSLVFGSLNGGRLTTFASLLAGEGSVVLVGWTMV